MSKKMEKKTADSVLLVTLQRLGLDKTPAAKNLLSDIAKPNVTSDLVDSISNMLCFALQQQKQAIQKALDALKT